MGPPSFLFRHAGVPFGSIETDKGDPPDYAHDDGNQPANQQTLPQSLPFLTFPQNQDNPGNRQSEGRPDQKQHPRQQREQGRITGGERKERESHFIPRLRSTM
jgi:hypothetical protein